MTESVKPKAKTPFSFVKSSHANRWAAKGPAKHLQPGRVIPVAKLDGSIVLKRITSVSKSFEHESGEPWALGFTTYNDLCVVCKDTEVTPGTRRCPPCQSATASASSSS